LVLLFRFAENIAIVSEDSGEGDWGDHPYSFIHTRNLSGCFADFRQQIVKRAFDYLEPGGWMESQELYPTVYCDDDTLKPDNAFLEWSNQVDEAWMTVGRPIRIGNKLKDWYKSVGFVDVHEEIFKLPLNGWPKDPKFKMLGRFNGMNLREGLAGFSFRPFNQAFGWTHEETEIYLTEVKKALMDRKVHYYNNVYENFLIY
jgi:metalloendopeptidase OMA1, mitochondrial